MDKKLFNYTISIPLLSFWVWVQKILSKIQKHLADIFDFSKVDESHELFSNKNKKLIGKFKNETPEKSWIDELIALRSKMYSFKCRRDSKNKLKDISKSQSKHIKFEEYKKSLDGEEYQEERNNYFHPSRDHEMHLQEIKNSTWSIFDDKQCYKKETESKPWN